jgi:uncharacterized protein
VLFPHLIVRLSVGRDATMRALERAMAGDRRVLGLTQRRSADDDPTAAGLYGVGVTASVIDLVDMGNGTIKVLVKSLKRVAVLRLAEGPFLTAEVVGIEETRGKDEEAIALSRAVLEKLKAVRKINFLRSSYNIWEMSDFIRDPSVLADAIAPRLSCEISQKQELLETSDVVARLQKVLALMQTDQQAA